MNPANNDRHSIGPMWTMAVALALAFSLSSATAWSESQDTGAREALQEASALERSGAYKEALRAATTGLNTAPRDRGLLQLQARLLYATHDYGAALSAYEALLDARPQLPPGDKRKVRKIIRDLRQAQSTLLELRLEDGPASVYLDDPGMGAVCENAAVCQRSLLPRRTYWVIVEREGHKRRQERVRLRPGQKTTLSVSLEEEPSRVVIEPIAPHDAEVHVDGTLIGTGEQTLENVAPGEHSVRVSLAGFVAHEETFAAHLGEPVHVRVSLDELVPVALSPDDAQLWLDDELVTLDEEGRVRVSSGAHQLRARAEGYLDGAVEILEGRARGATVTLALEPEPEPPPPPPPSSSSWTGWKIGLVATSGALSLAGYGVATKYELDARRAWRQTETECEAAESGLLLCTDAGYEAGSRARAAALRADRFLVGGLVMSMALVGTLNMNERAREGQGGSSTWPWAWSWQRKVSLAGTVAVSGAGLALGIRHGVRARSRRQAAQVVCPDWPVCGDEGFFLAESARDDARKATLAFVVAGAATATAVSLWWTAPSFVEEMELVPAVGRDHVGVHVAGAF